MNDEQLLAYKNEQRTNLQLIQTLQNNFNRLQNQFQINEVKQVHCRGD